MKIDLTEKKLRRGWHLHALVVAVPLALLATAASAAYNVKISTGATNNGTLSGGVFTPTGNGAVLNVTDLQNALATSDVTVTTGSGGSQAGDITVANKVLWSSHKLTLDAYLSVIFKKLLKASSTAALDIETNDGGSGGDYTFNGGHVTFQSSSEALAINGASYTLVPDISTFVTDATGNPTGKFAFMDNYDAASGVTYTQSPYNGAYSATLEGLGNTISNFKLINSTVTSTDVAFIAESHGIIRDINFTNALVSSSASNTRIGIITAVNYGAISHVSVDGSVSAGPTTIAGGLAAINNNSPSKVLDCSADVTVTGTTSTQLIGGLIGLNGGIITDSFATGSVSITAPRHGGRKPSLLPTLTFAAGGLTGKSEGPGTITESYATGSVTGGDNYQVGGLIGWNLAAVNNTYAMGSAQAGTGGTAGGLVGTESSPGGVGSSYSTGAPSGGSGAVVGGFVGEDDFSGSISTSYWDTTASGITNLAHGAGNISNDIGITGLSDTALKSGLPSGFSSSVWGESVPINGGLPYLLDLPPP